MASNAELEARIARLESIVEVSISNDEREHPGDNCPRCGGCWGEGRDMWLNPRRVCMNCFYADGKKLK